MIHNITRAAGWSSAWFRRVRSSWVLAATLAVAVVAAACVPSPPPPPPPQCSGCKVYLTFDDGPGVYTPQILSVLQSKGVPATFFVIGEHAAQYPSLVQQEHAAGEGTGNHTWDHQDLTTLPPDQVRTELQSTSDEIATLIGTRPTLWRPPYGAFNATDTQTASSSGLSMRLWDVNPEDYTLPGTDQIVSRVVNNVSNNAIILLHDSAPTNERPEDRSQTVAALPTIIDTLRSLGYSFGTLATTSGATSTPTGPTGPRVPIGGE